MSICNIYIYSGNFDKIFLGLHIVQGKESFKHFINS